MFGIGGVEFILILLFVFIVFGADRLPEIARVLGKAIAKFRKAQAEMNAAIQSDVNNLETDEQPFQKSVEAFDKFGREMVDTAKKTANDVSKSGLTKPKGQAATVAGAAASDAKPAAKTDEESAKPVSAPKPITASAVSAGGIASTSKPASTATVAPTAASTPRRESFTERKARYEAERAAREAAAAKAAKEAEAVPAPAPEAAPAPAPASAAPAAEEGKGE